MRPVARAGVAVGGGAAVLVAQLGVAGLSLQLSARVIGGELPAAVGWAPQWTFSLALVWLAVVFRRDSATGLEWFGPLLVAAAPFTAFGGSCRGVDVAQDFTLHLSGVRLGVLSGGCSTYLNGALLLLGAALLGLGLWVSLEAD